MAPLQARKGSTNFQKNSRKSKHKRTLSKQSHLNSSKHKCIASIFEELSMIGRNRTPFSSEDPKSIKDIKIPKKKRLFDRLQEDITTHLISPTSN